MTMRPIWRKFFAMAKRHHLSQIQRRLPTGRITDFPSSTVNLVMNSNDGPSSTHSFEHPNQLGNLFREYCSQALVTPSRDVRSSLDGIIQMICFLKKYLCLASSCW
jgi:hypothetical protein